jgi:hypothetical protein
MRRSASDRARGVMTKSAVHRKSELLRTSIGTLFNGFLGLWVSSRSQSMATSRRVSWAAVFPISQGGPATL